jgi:hypothetical protein
MGPGAAAAYEPPPVLYAGPAQGSTAFVGIVKKGDRYRAYVSDATAKRATLSVWFRGTLGTDGHLTGTAYGVTLDARLERRNAAGTVALPDGRVLSFAAKSGFGGGLVERNYVFDGVRYRSGWIVLEDNRVRGRTTIAGTALDGSSSTGPGIRPNPSCEQLVDDYGALRAQRGKLLHQSGIWERRLNLGRGSGAAYNRLNQAIGALDIMIFDLERRGVPYAACDSPAAGPLS